MTLEQISTVNRERAKEWHKDEQEPWSLADWGNALAGEVGELCNVIKKIRRIQTGVDHRLQEHEIEVLVSKAMDEVADVWLYLDLTLEQLSKVGMFDGAETTMSEVVASKFNRTSEQFGFNHRVEG